MMKQFMHALNSRNKASFFLLPCSLGMKLIFCDISWLSYDVSCCLILSYDVLVFFSLLSFTSDEEWVRGFPLVTGCRASSKTAYARVVTGVIVAGMIVALLTLVAGSVLSTQNG